MNTYTRNLSTTTAIGLLMIMCAFNACLLNAEERIVETVEVTGKLFSDESQSRNTVIITAADLQQLKIANMEALFSFFTALNTSKKGIGETSFDITMRGSNFEQVLVLVDGTPINNAQTGHFNCDFPFAIEDVERVEIVRGGSSTTYGAGAFAGVVHIILKKNTSEKNPLNISLSGGEKKYYAASVQAGQTFKNVGFRVSASKNNSDGFYAGQELDLLKLHAGLFYTGKDMEMEVQAGYMDKDFGAAGFYAAYPSTERIQSYYSQLRVQRQFKKWEGSFNYAFTRHEDFFVLDRTRPTFFQNSSDTTQHFFNGLFTYKTTAYTLATGGEIREEVIKSVVMGNRQRTRGALFAHVNIPINHHLGADFGLRRNFEPANHSNFTYNIGLYQRFAGSFVLRASYGKSFRLASFTELFYNSPTNSGNANLEPEVSHNIEASFSWLSARYQADVSFFYRNQQGMIDWVQNVTPIGSMSPWRAVNLVDHDVIGFEVTQRVQLKRTVLSLGIERLTALHAQTDVLSKYGLRFPDFSIKANIVQPLGHFAQLAASYTYKEIYKTSEKGHFMNLTLTVPIKHLELGLRLDNLFNNIIEEIPGLKVAGRWAYISISYKR